MAYTNRETLAAFSSRHVHVLISKFYLNILLILFIIYLRMMKSEKNLNNVSFVRKKIDDIEIKLKNLLYLNFIQIFEKLLLISSFYLNFSWKTLDNPINGIKADGRCFWALQIPCILLDLMPKNDSDRLDTYSKYCNHYISPNSVMRDLLQM